MAKLRRDRKIGAWNGSGALYGTRAQVKEARRLVRKALKGKATRLEFLDDRKLRLASMFAKPYGWISGWNLNRMLAVLKPVYGLMKGIPTDQPLSSTYWRKRNPPPADMNPDRDRCGLLWCSPVAPNDGEHARRVTALASGVVLRHGFEPMISMTVLTERALSCIVSISYDREVSGEDARANECYQELLQRLADNGYHSYRLGIGAMSAMQDGSSYDRLLEVMKNTFDSNGILSPGRYLTPATAKAKDPVNPLTFEITR
jgi:4-cresol dehydrogenase (hydroxylating)